MLGTYITFPELLIWLPLLTGILCFFTGSEKSARSLAVTGSLLVLAVSIATLFYTNNDKYHLYNNVSYYWLKYIGNSFSVGIDGIGRMLTLLTAVTFPMIMIGSASNKVKNAPSFFGLMMLAQSGLMGVFVAKDALLFYFFWELALIPVYFLCSMWGGERRIPVTFKFFVYTFLGSLMMLVGIIYVYQQTGTRVFEDGTTSAHSFALAHFYSVKLSAGEQTWLFWLFFVAFAIKMPIFPFHTWQPDTYDQAPTQVTMVLSAVMVKMGLFGVFRWLIPIFPEATARFDNIVIILCIIGILYASCLALVQDNLKKLVAYSSIAHIGLMCATLFAKNDVGVQGSVIQMFNHGINIVGMWLAVEIIERQTGIKEISKLRGIADKAPIMSIMLIVIALANIALGPLMNTFPGEFLMFSGLYQYNQWYTVLAGLGIILAAIYTLNMVQRIFFGAPNEVVAEMKDATWNEKLILTLIVVIIFATGVYPQPLIDLTKEAVGIFVTR